MTRFAPDWLPLGMGSVPYTNPNQAWSSVLRSFPQTPFWPQLPRRSYLENMYVQFSEAFPGVVLEDRHIYVDRRQDLDPGLERLYLAYLEDDLAYGAIGPDFSAGLAELQTDSVVLGEPLLLKGQVTGPISWGLTVVDQNRRPLLYDEILADAIAKHLRLKATWQERTLASRGTRTIIFVDEPYMSAFGSAFISLSREQALLYLHEVIAGISGLKGIHCCGNTDWALLLDTPIDILSLDAYEYAQSLALYPQEITAFLERGGAIAWGIVPAGDAAGSETAEHLVERLHEAIDSLAAKGVPREALLSAGLVSPSCGCGSLEPALAERVLELTAQVSALMRQKYVTAEVQSV